MKKTLTKKRLITLLTTASFLLPATIANAQETDPPQIQSETVTISASIEERSKEGEIESSLDLIPNETPPDDPSTIPIEASSVESEDQVSEQSSNTTQQEEQDTLPYQIESQNNPQDIAGNEEHTINELENSNESENAPPIKQLNDSIVLNKEQITPNSKEHESPPDSSSEPEKEEKTSDELTQTQDSSSTTLILPSNQYAFITQEEASAFARNVRKTHQDIKRHTIVRMRDLHYNKFYVVYLYGKDNIRLDYNPELDPRHYPDTIPKDEYPDIEKSEYEGFIYDAKDNVYIREKDHKRFRKDIINESLIEVNEYGKPLPITTAEVIKLIQNKSSDSNVNESSGKKETPPETKLQLIHLQQSIAKSSVLTSTIAPILPNTSERDSMTIILFAYSLMTIGVIFLFTRNTTPDSKEKIE